MFSPYYARARRRGAARADDYCALNVALYGPRAERWALTEYRPASTARSKDTFTLGANNAHWNGRELVIELEERCAPAPRRVRGTVRIEPQTDLRTEAHVLDSAARHIWTPIAPLARATLALSHPRIAWSGDAYIDSNAGTTSLESDFEGWTWSRARAGDEVSVCYDVVTKTGISNTLRARFGRGEAMRPHPLPYPCDLAPSRWRLERRAHSETRGEASLLRTLEDTPFYARSLVRSRLHGQLTTAVHESLSLARFRSRWVQWMLPFRMRRR